VRRHRYHAVSGASPSPRPKNISLTGFSFSGSNRRPEDAAFLAELQTLERQNPNYKLIASMTEMEKWHRPWHGETGVIGNEMLARYLKDASSPVYYIAGPPGMVKGMHMMINESGVDEGDIRTEEFSGY
jgi:ferredoxin-NADP reductase